MTDQLLYRLNRVPDRLYITFLDLLGVQPAPADAGPRRRHVLAVGATGGDRRGAGDRPRSRPSRTVRRTTPSCSRPPRTWSSPPHRCATWPPRPPDGQPVARDDELSLGDGVPVLLRRSRRSTTRCSSASTTPRRAARSRSGSTATSQGVGVDPTDAAAGLGGVGRLGVGRRATSTATSTGGLNRPGDVVLHVPTQPRRVADRQPARRLAALPDGARRRGLPVLQRQPRPSRPRRRSPSAARSRPCTPRSSTDEVLGLSEGVPGPGVPARAPTGRVRRRAARGRGRGRRRAGSAGRRSTRSPAATPSDRRVPARPRDRRRALRPGGPRARRHAAPATAPCRRRARRCGCRSTGSAAGRRGNVVGRDGPRAAVDRCPCVGPGREPAGRDRRRRAGDGRRGRSCAARWRCAPATAR